jgi:hypothetical protein
MGWVELPVGDMTAAFARDRDFDFYRAVAAIAQVGPRIAKRWIHEAAGNTLLRNLFRGTWPPVDDIGDLTVSSGAWMVHAGGERLCGLTGTPFGPGLGYLRSPGGLGTGDGDDRL